MIMELRNNAYLRFFFVQRHVMFPYMEKFSLSQHYNVILLFNEIFVFFGYWNDLFPYMEAPSCFGNIV